MQNFVKTGLERLCGHPYRERLRGRKVGLCCNPTAIDRQFRHAVDLLAEIDGCQLVALFGPEHGIRGEAQDMIGVHEQQIDRRTGVPIYSLYGNDQASLRPTPDMLEGIDLLLFDIQDIGSRYYTYIYTMSYLMEAAAEADIELWILDRPNPIGGASIEGPLIADGYRSFVGRFPISNRHGMTAGELALMFRDLFEIRCRLEIVKIENWRRRQWFDQTGLPWVMPSPNMPTLDTATVYAGGCLLEGTNLSEGRGTTRPFEIFGAPYLDSLALAEILANYQLPGAVFRPLSFQPTFHKWHGQSCGGVQIHVVNREIFQPFLTGVAILHACHFLAPSEFAWRTEAYEFVDHAMAIDLLCGSPQIRMAIEAGTHLHEIAETWLPEQQRFSNDRTHFLLYPDE